MTDPKQHPRVSVIVPCHNLGRYINEAVDSVLAQTLQDFEIIVVNDGSTDEYTNGLLAKYKKDKTRVLTIENKGPSGARNFGITHSKAPCIICLDSDDILEPTCLEKALSVMEERPDTGIASFWYKAFEGDEWEHKPDLCTLDDILGENRICVSAMFPRRAWEEVGGYDERFKGALAGCEDWDFWIGIMKRGYRLRIIKEFLFRYRVRGDSVSIASKIPENRYSIMKMIIEKHKDIYQKNAIEVLLGKEKIIGDMLDYQRQLLEAQQWYKRQQSDLLEAKEYFLKQIESYQEENARRGSEILRQKNEIVQKDSEISRLWAEIRQQQHTINVKDHELRSICFSKVWKLGCAFRDAGYSCKGLLLLPFRVLDLACPESVKRFIRRLLLLQPHEVIKKNFYKFPYRLADRLLPRALKQVFPYQLRNIARSLFRTTDERIFRLDEWSGPLVSVIVPSRRPEEALKGIAAQTFGNHETVLVGPESYESVRKALAARNGQPMKTCPCSEDFSQGERLNYAITKAEGKYICCFEDGVVLEPTYLEKMLFLAEVYKRDMIYPDLNPYLGDPLLLGNLLRSAVFIFSRTVWNTIGGYKYIGAAETKAEIDLDFIERALWYGFRPFFHSSSRAARPAGVGGTDVYPVDCCEGIRDRWNRLSASRSLRHVRDNLRARCLAENPFVNLIRKDGSGPCGS
ncbi:MAG: glycosyltransferase [Candidatus Aureabacteria bacterium]|nr:glycosyltransferase [Candidatus Auribacterota bacterium]